MPEPGGPPRSADHGDPAAARLSSRRERKGIETRERIIAEATTLFLERGYESTALLDITEAAQVSGRTFYFYFDSKADVALARFYEWMEDLLEAFESRPEDESPQQMHVGALRELREMGYVTGDRLRDSADRPLVPVAMGVLFAETNPEVAGRIYHSLVQAQNTLTALFRRRLGYAPGALEPRIIAAAFTASWFVAVHGFDDVRAVDPDPPTPDALGERAFAAYVSGIGGLWGEGIVAGGLDGSPPDEPSISPG